MKSYYFDANALFKYYKDEKGSLQIRRLVAMYRPILVSNLTLLECCSTVMKYRREGKLKQRNVNRFFERLRKDTSDNTTSRPFLIISISEESFKQAQNLLFLYAGKYSIGSNDALHLVIVQKLSSQPILVTSDGAFQRVCERNQMTFYDPEKDFPTQFDKTHDNHPTI
jgi:predicted nucleic acid-binding protein